MALNMNMSTGNTANEVNKNANELIRQLVSGRNVTFITTKNPDYIRCSQEIRLLRQCAAKVRVIGSDKDSYPARLREIYCSIRRTDFGDDVIFIGFAQQLVLPIFHKKFEGHVIIQDFFISVYDTLVQDRRKFKKGSIPARFAHWLDEKTLRYGNLVIADTNADAEYFSEEFHRKREDFLTLYLEADPAFYRMHSTEMVDEDENSMGINRMNEKYEINDNPDEGNQAIQSNISKRKAEENRGETAKPFRILYFGSVLPLQGVDVIMEAVQCLFRYEDDELGGTFPQGQMSRLSFEIIGPVPDEMKIKDNRVNYIDWVSQEELAGHIAKADLCLAGHFSGDIDKAKRTIAGKTFIYLAMGKPIILGDCPANRELFQEKIGEIYYCRMGDPESLADAVMRAYRDLKPF